MRPSWEQVWHLDLAAETDRVIKLQDGKVVSDETTAPASVAV
jgi:hypothetical protein